jgi:hypothetical protein
MVWIWFKCVPPKRFKCWKPDHQGGDVERLWDLERQALVRGGWATEGIIKRD